MQAFLVFTQLIPIARIIGIASISVLMGVISSPVAAAPMGEQALTLAFIYNFMKLSEWPEGAVSRELTLCVTDGTFDQDSDSISDWQVQDKTVRVKRLVPSETPRECQLMFLTRDEKPVRVREWLKAVENTPVLTVSNMNGFLEMGGMIALINDGNHLQFEINLDQTKRVNLKLSSQLLQVARQVRGK